MDLLESMGILLAVLGAGFVLGRVVKLPPAAQKVLSVAQSICVWVLIFVMGVRLGADAKILAKLPVLGGKAVVITLLAVAGSVLAAYLAAAALKKRGDRT